MLLLDVPGRVVPLGEADRAESTLERLEGSHACQTPAMRDDAQVAEDT